MLADVGGQLRDGRLAANLSQVEVGAAIGVSRSEIGRIERGRAPAVPVKRLARFAAIVGQDLTMRLFPAGQPLRDVAQLALIARFRGLIADRLRWQSEMPLAIPGDRRAWDGAILGPGWTVYIDAETRVHDVQALQRRTTLKARDTPTERWILVLADTRHNRSVVAAVGSLLHQGLPPTQILAALAAGRDPGGAGVVLV